MLGDGGVGKTAITMRFVSDRFVPDYDPTVEDAYVFFLTHFHFGSMVTIDMMLMIFFICSYKKDYQVEGKDISVEIIDTAGQEEYVE
jgi:GTPase KRas